MERSIPSTRSNTYSFFLPNKLHYHVQKKRSRSSLCTESSFLGNKLLEERFGSSSVYIGFRFTCESLLPRFHGKCGCYASPSPLQAKGYVYSWHSIPRWDIVKRDEGKEGGKAEISEGNWSLSSWMEELWRKNPQHRSWDCYSMSNLHQINC